MNSNLIQNSKFKIQNSPNGFSLVEIMLSVSVFAILVTALTGAWLYGQEATMLAGNRGRAVSLAEEGLEAVRNIRDHAFANLADGTYGLTTAGNQWNLSGSSDITDIFTRQVVISSVDTKRKSVTANLTWQQNSQRTGLVSLASRFTNWVVTSVGNWANAIQEAFLNISGNEDGLKIQVVGNYAYVVRNNGTPDFAVIDVSTPASPVLVGSLSLNGLPRNLYVAGNYAYIASDANSEELQIINIATPSSPSVVGTFNNAGSDNATGVYVIGATAYMTFDGGNEFSIVNVSNPALPSLLSTLNLTGNSNEIVVSGSYAYIASSNNSQELQVIDISIPSSPSQVASLNLSGSINSDTIAIAGSTLFIGQGSTFYTVNISTPTSPTVLGSISTSDTINDIALNLGNGNTYVFVATSNNSSEFQVIDVSTLSAPVLLGSVNTAGNDNLNGIAYDVVLDRAFGASASNSKELFIFAPQ